MIQNHVKMVEIIPTEFHDIQEQKLVEDNDKEVQNIWSEVMVIVKILKKIIQKENRNKKWVNEDVRDNYVMNDWIQ